MATKTKTKATEQMTQLADCGCDFVYSLRKMTNGADFIPVKIAYCQLHSQAPAMLELLQSIIEQSHITASVRGGSLTGAEMRLIDRAEAILAKVRGQ